MQGKAHAIRRLYRFASGIEDRPTTGDTRIGCANLVVYGRELRGFRFAVRRHGRLLRTRDFTLARDVAWSFCPRRRRIKRVRHSRIFSP